MKTEEISSWRCDVTGNPVGTDTRMIGAQPCACQGCRAALTTRAETAGRKLAETMEARMPTESQVRKIWNDATNSVCQTMQDKRMCNCPDGSCLAAAVEPSQVDITNHTGMTEQFRAARIKGEQP